MCHGCCESVRVTSLEQFIKVCREWADERAPNKNEYITPWWRGQADAQWHLTPGVYRSPAAIRTRRDKGPFGLAEERRLLEIFKAHGRAVVQPRPESDAEWYFLMRHYGLPTRLLDWSENPLVALFMALRDNVLTAREPKSDGGPPTCAAVWGLDPGVLNRQWHRTGIFWGDDDAVRGYMPGPLSQDCPIGHSVQPVAVQPPNSNARIVAQASRFTIHGWDRSGLDEQVEDWSWGAEPPITKLVIPTCCEGPVYDDLHRIARVTQDALFPDLEGLAEALSEAYAFKLG